METTRCPECGQHAEVVDRAVLDSTDGPVEHAHVRCVQRHRFWLPVAYLTREPVGVDAPGGSRGAAGTGPPPAPARAVAWGHVVAP